MANTPKEQIFSSKHLVFDSLSARSTDIKEQWTSPTNNPADFTINFGNSDFTQGQIIHLLPVDIHIPNLFNNVTERNNEFKFEDGQPGLTILITMPIGHYTADEWCTEFTAQVLASTSLVTVLSCSVNTITGLLSIQMSGPWSMQQTASASTPGSGILLGLTFEQFEPSNEILSDGNDTITFDNPPAFQGPQCVVIHSNFLTSANSVLGPNHQQFTMIDTVSLADTPFGLTKHHFTRTDNVRSIAFPASANLSSIEVCLRDVDGTRLTLPSNQKVCYHFIISFGRDST